MCWSPPESMSDEKLLREIKNFRRFKDEATEQWEIDFYQREIEILEKEAAERGLMSQI